MTTTEISQEFLAMIKMSFGQMIETADKLNNDYATNFGRLITREQEIINSIINDAKSILSQMDGFV